MDTPTSSWYLYNSLMGIGDYLGPPHYDIAYFCPTCGEVWARIIFSYFPDNILPGHSPRRRHCPNHGPGFLLTYNNIDINRSAPLLVLEREFLKAVDYGKTNLPYETALIPDNFHLNWSLLT